MRIQIRERNKVIAVLFWGRESIRKYNHHHDKLGRFASSDGSGGGNSAGEGNSRNSVELRSKRVRIKQEEKVTISPDKFYKYALDPVNSPDKANAFQEALGYTNGNCESLISQIKENIRDQELSFSGDNGHGLLYECIMDIKGPNGKTARVLTAWIKEKDGYRMTSVYVARRGRKQK